MVTNKTSLNFGDVYRERKVLIFGDTGFKGSWLTIWLQNLGATVIGASNGVPTKPSHFDAASLAKIYTSHRLDIRDCDRVKDLVKDVRPDFIFHLAAQELVKKSYELPVETYETNSVGMLTFLKRYGNLTIHTQKF